MNLFDQKFGRNFLESIPPSPGVYRFSNQEAVLIYVGKAKNLRRRLSQYKNAKRRKKHRKMRKILDAAVRVEFEICQTEFDALLLETKLIQQFRPKWNIAGAFYFLYPMIGMRWNLGVTQFCYSTQPDLLSEFKFHGAFRSREITGEAFFSLMDLLKYIGHFVPKSKKSKKPMPKYSYVYSFRQLPNEWMELWDSFWNGSSKEILERLILALVENADARANSVEVQKAIQKLSRFWDHEASLLLKARKSTQFTSYPVSQKERDILFLEFRKTTKVVLEQVSPQQLPR